MSYPEITHNDAKRDRGYAGGMIFWQGIVGRMEANYAKLWSKVVTTRETSKIALRPTYILNFERDSTVMLPTYL